MKNLLAQTFTIPWQDATGGTTTKPLKGPLDAGTFGGQITIGSIISRSISLIFLFAGMGLLLMLLGSGFTYLTSAGDPKKMEKAKGQLTNALIGFLVIFVAFWVVQASGYIFGLDAISTIFPSN